MCALCSCKYLYMYTQTQTLCIGLRLRSKKLQLVGVNRYPSNSISETVHYAEATGTKLFSEAIYVHTCVNVCMHACIYINTTYIFKHILCILIPTKYTYWCVRALKILSLVSCQILSLQSLSALDPSLLTLSLL